jgi:putative transposase
VLGIREDGQKLLLAVKNIGGESESAWRALLDDLTARGLRRPELVIVDGAPGLEKARLSKQSTNSLHFCCRIRTRSRLQSRGDRLRDG